MYETTIAAWALYRRAFQRPSLDSRLRLRLTRRSRCQQLQSQRKHQHGFEANSGARLHLSAGLAIQFQACSSPRIKKGKGTYLVRALLHLHLLLHFQHLLFLRKCQGPRYPYKQPARANHPQRLPTPRYTRLEERAGGRESGTQHASLLGWDHVAKCGKTVCEGLFWKDFTGEV